MQEENPWKVLSSRTAYENPWIRVREDTVITPLGNEGLYGVIETNDSVIVVVLNDKREVYFIRQYRYPAGAWKWELPAGGGDHQDPLIASRRELEEETGILAHTWEKLGATRVCNGLMTERMNIYLARDLEFTGTKEVSDEKIADARFVPLSEVKDMVADGTLDDGQSITALYYLERWLEKHPE